MDLLFKNVKGIPKVVILSRKVGEQLRHVTFQENTLSLFGVIRLSLTHGIPFGDH